jgi:ABC-2 type transport system ATP-binding protein
MDRVVFESVRKVFRHRPALFNWMGRERGGETMALENLSFSAADGQVLILLGPNGSGKTTALNARRVRQQVGIAVATERSFFPRLSARENLEFFAALDEVPARERRGRINEVLHETGLEEQADTLVMKFSSGMYQRLGIARALVKRPSVLLLDEPTRSLDAGTTAHFWTTVRALARQQTTILLATHNFAEAAAIGHRLLLLHRGQLLAGRLVRTGESAESLRSFYFHMTGEVDEASGALHQAEILP